MTRFACFTYSLIVANTIARPSALDNPRFSAKNAGLLPPIGLSRAVVVTTGGFLLRFTELSVEAVPASYGGKTVFWLCGCTGRAIGRNVRRVRAIDSTAGVG